MRRRWARSPHGHGGGVAHGAAATCLARLAACAALPLPAATCCLSPPCSTTRTHQLLQRREDESRRGHTAWSPAHAIWAHLYPGGHFRQGTYQYTTRAAKNGARVQLAYVREDEAQRPRCVPGAASGRKLSTVIGEVPVIGVFAVRTPVHVISEAHT